MLGEHGLDHSDVGGDEGLPQRPSAPAAHIASSAGIADRNAALAGPSSSVHAMTRSQAGSPTPHVPKSITAVSVPPSSTRRLPEATSPWNQIGGPVHVAARAASQTSVAQALSTRAPRAVTARRVWSS